MAEYLSGGLTYDERFRLREVEEYGIIRLDDEILSGCAAALRAELRFAVAKGHKTVGLEITSPGGDVYESIAMYTSIMELRAKGITVIGRVYGFAASCASMIILQACDKRVASKDSRLLIHEIARGTGFGFEKKSATEDELKETKALFKWMIGVLVTRTGKSAATLEEKIDRHERWFSADEAKEFGLIDEVI